MKYRVFDKNEKCYVTNDCCWVLKPDGDLAENIYGDIIGRPECIPEFSTGEVDKNGVEIYENDIVSIRAYPKGRYNTLVYFKGGKFAVNGTNYNFKDIAAKTYVVVGNVHDGVLK